MPTKFIISNQTKNIQSGSGYTRTLNRSGQKPEDLYKSYVGDSNVPDFLKFPPDYPDYTMILVARDYQLGGQAAIANLKGEFKSGYVLPLPQMRLGDRYQIGYDDNYSWLTTLIGDIDQNRFAKIAKGTFGFSINKFKTVLLEAPVMKRHEFVWKLSPKNEAESKIINDIVRRLKVDMAPPRSGPGKVFFAMPYIFDIYFEPNHAYMYGFKPCVIESIDIDYSGGNPQPSIYKSGAPESVVLTINLLEIEMWSREDYEAWNKSNNPRDTISKFGLSDSSATPPISDAQPINPGPEPQSP